MGVKLAEYRDCTGCSLCSNVCPADAVRMATGPDGFHYPQIEEERCITCKKCVRACPILSFHKQQVERRIGYAAALLDAKELRQAASGGVATALYRIFLKKGYKVAGVNQKNEYVLTYKKEDILQFQGSKYIETRKKEIYQEILDSLQKKEKVLFIGLPCECAAVKRIAEDKDGLVICSLICHGPTSPGVLENFQKEAGKNVRTIRMRAKDIRHTLVVKTELKNGKIKEQPFYSTDFGKAFERYGRESCYHCQFKSGTSGADLSIGDLWGGEYLNVEFPENDASFIAVHTNKGYDIAELLKQEMEMVLVDYDKAVSYNPMFDTSRKKKCNLVIFQKNFEKYGLHKALRKELGVSWLLEKYKNNMKYTLKRKMRK